MYVSKFHIFLFVFGYTFVNKYIVYNTMGTRKATVFCTCYVTAQLSFPGVKRPDRKFNQPPDHGHILTDFTYYTHYVSEHMLY
jgi:hypothetical protein